MPYNHKQAFVLVSRLIPISQGELYFNPFEGWSEAVERARSWARRCGKALGVPIARRKGELSRRCFLFSVFTGLAVPTCRACELHKSKRAARRSGISARQDRKRKWRVCSPDSPDGYFRSTKKEGLQLFPDTMSRANWLPASKWKRRVAFFSLTYHMARHSFGTLTLEAGIPMKRPLRWWGIPGASTQSY